MDIDNPSADTGNGSDNAQAGAAAFGSRHGGQGAAEMRNRLNSLKAELDALVNRAPNLSDDELAREHARLMTQFSTLRYAARGIADQASQQFNRGMETASQQFSRGMETTTVYVKEKPMQSMAVAAGAGLILGMLFKRR